MSTKDWMRFGLLSLAWGSSFLWIKIAVTEVSPLVVVGFRTLSGALGLLMVILLNGKSSALRWQAFRPWLGVFAVIGMFNVAVPFILITWSEQYIGSGIASILNSTVPLFTIVLAPLFLPDDRFSLPKLSGLLIGFVGVVLLFAPELAQGLSSQSITGQGVMLLATLSYASASVFIRKYTRGMDSQVQAFFQLVMATLFVWILAFFTERPLVLPQLPITWVAILWLGLIGACLAYILFFSLIHSIETTRTTTVTYILPLIGVILGAVFLGEQISVISLLGGALIISGVVVVNMRRLPFTGRHPSAGDL